MCIVIGYQVKAASASQVSLASFDRLTPEQTGIFDYSPEIWMAPREPSKPKTDLSLNDIKPNRRLTVFCQQGFPAHKNGAFAHVKPLSLNLHIQIGFLCAYKQSFLCECTHTHHKQQNQTCACTFAYKLRVATGAFECLAQHNPSSWPIRLHFSPSVLLINPVIKSNSVEWLGIEGQIPQHALADVHDQSCEK